MVGLNWFGLKLGHEAMVLKVGLFGERLEEGPRLVGIGDWLSASILLRDGFIASYILSSNIGIRYPLIAGISLKTQMTEKLELHLFRNRWIG